MQRRIPGMVAMTAAALALVLGSSDAAAQQGDGQRLERARERCEDYAENLGYRVQQRVAEERLRGGDYRIRYTLRRSGRTTTHDCFHERQADNVRLIEVSARDDDFYTGGQAAERARQQCTALARSYGYTVDRFTAQDEVRRDAWVLRARLRGRDGVTVQDCHYDARRDRASLPSVAGGGYNGGNVVARAQQQCSALARNYGYTVERFSGQNEVRGGEWVLRTRLRRGNGTLVLQDCHYDARRDQASLPSLSAGGGLGASPQMAERARQACIATARSYGFTVDRFTMVDEVRSGEWLLGAEFRGSAGTTLQDCTYDARRNLASIPGLASRSTTGAPGGYTGTQVTERAREVCAEGARRNNYTVVEVGQARLQNDGRYHVSVRVRTNSMTVRCTYDPRTDSAYVP